MPSRNRRQLQAVEKFEIGQGVAQLLPDPDRPSAWTLVVDGTPQSHVDLADPRYLEFEYQRWFGHVVDSAFAAGSPVNVLHLGGGAWTLARYVAATRPGSRQRVVELDAELVQLVRDRLPAAPDSGIRVRVGEAREVLEGLTDASADLVVLDVFAGARIPAHLTSGEFVAQVARVLRPQGVFAMNLADGARTAGQTGVKDVGGLAFARAEAATVGTVFPHTALLVQPTVLRGRRFGNLVLLGSRRPLPVVDLTRAAAGDPFPARVLDGNGLAAFTARAAPITDATAAPSPLPPSATFSV